MATFRFISDPGHGWLEVPWVELQKVGLKATDFSKYSYRDGGAVYLEEDCDLPKFLTVYEAKHGKAAFVDVYVGRDCFVRNLPPIRQAA